MENFSAEYLYEILVKLVSTPIFSVKNTPITFTSILILSLLLYGVFVASKLAKKTLLHRVFPKVKIELGTQYTLARLSQYLIVVLGFIFAFQFIGIDLSGLTVIFGLLSVGIGFGLQNLTSNFVSGLIVLFERPISVGDRVLINDIEGDVTEINIRSTKIQSIHNISYIVPNTDFVSNTVVNYSHGESHIKIDINVGVSYSSDLDLVKKVLREIGESHPAVDKSKGVEIFLVSFGDSAWDMRLRVWIRDPKKRLHVVSDINSLIVDVFRKNMIEIPFPQRDLYLRGLSAPEWNSEDHKKLKNEN